MSELFAWVPWFQELGQKISAGGPNYLAPRAREIPWTADATKTALLRYGDEQVDPFSFLYVLASKNRWESARKRVHGAVSELFELATKVDFSSGFYYPTPEARGKLLFHSRGRGNSDLLWRLFRSAVAGLDSIKGREFDEALSIKNVGVSKLTEALFLINPTEFVPFDNQSLIPLQRKLDRVKQVNNWETYRQELATVCGLFPGCEPYEIQHFAYAVFGRTELDGREDAIVWQTTGRIEGTNGTDYWPDFRENGWTYLRKPQSDLHKPVPGDVVVVRDGIYDGRGIGVVHRNDHGKAWTPEQRLHVLWVNTVGAPLSEITAGTLFSRGDAVMQKLRSAPAYAATFELLKSLGWHLDEPGIAPSPQPDPPLSPPIPLSRDLKSLAPRVLVSVKDLQEIVDLLRDKKQVIFQGPPGTGKTYLARKLAECLAGSPDRVRLVQFHPSYSYEDFVQGFRPTLKKGKAGFVLRNGPLVQMAKAARQSEEEHFLIIDEINRGNLSKILGELYFLLEYRNQKMQLQYSDKAVSLPDNLYIIGTMNTADRSIALVDLALRRRFHFVDFHPHKPLIHGLLSRWLAQNAPDMQWVSRVVDKANERLDDRHAAIGPSYFMREGLDDAKVRKVWKHSVLPYIEERLFGQEDVSKRFNLKRLREETEGKTSQPEGETADAPGTGESEQ